MKKAAAGILLIVSLCAVAAAQGTRQGSPTSGVVVPARKSSGADRGRLPKSITADDSLRAGESGDAVEQLLDKYMLAQGGAKLFAIRSRVMRGRVEMSLSDISGSFESYEKTPNKSMSVLNAPTGQFIQAFDGSKRWLQSPWGGAVTLGGDEADLLKSAVASGKGFKWRNRFSSANIRGRAVVDGHETIALDATPLGRPPVVLYFDADTGLLRKQEFVRRGPPQENELQAVYIDVYGQVDGVKVPSVFRQVYANFTLTFRIYEVKHNVFIEDALFQSPNAQ
jgi:hypothetical protein